MRTLLAALAALPLLGGVAHATLITGSSSNTSSSTSNDVTLSNQLNNFSFDLGIGGTKQLNVLTVTTDADWFSGSHSFSITENFTFTAPGSGSSGGDVGTGSFAVSLFAVNNGGSLTWSDGGNGTNVTLGGGWVVNVNLSNLDFSGDAASGGSETVVGTFTLVSGPTAVPEPASMALLGMGLLGLAAVRRRARG